jgi:hypothetical protein
MVYLLLTLISIIASFIYGALAFSDTTQDTYLNQNYNSGHMIIDHILFEYSDALLTKEKDSFFLLDTLDIGIFTIENACSRMLQPSYINTLYIPLYMTIYEMCLEQNKHYYAYPVYTDVSYSIWTEFYMDRMDISDWEFTLLVLPGYYDYYDYVEHLQFERYVSTYMEQLFLLSNDV